MFELKYTQKENFWRKNKKANDFKAERQSSNNNLKNILYLE